MFNESPTNVTTSSDRYAHCTVDTSSLTRARTISLTHSTASAVNGYATLAHPITTSGAAPGTSPRPSPRTRAPAPAPAPASRARALFALPTRSLSPRPRDAVIRRRRRRTLRDGTHQPIPPALAPPPRSRGPRTSPGARAPARAAGDALEYDRRNSSDILRPLETASCVPAESIQTPGRRRRRRRRRASIPPDGAYGREALHRRALSSHHLHALDRVAGDDAQVILAVVSLR